MNKIHAVITGIGGYVPEYKLTNEEISTMVDTSDEWILKRIGIKERRILKPEEGKGITYLALKAIEDLKSRHDFDPLEIDAVLFATATPDYPFPNSASLIAHKVGITNAFGFDMEAACSGFIYALEVAQGFIVSGKHKKVMIIAGDVLSVFIDYSDRNTSPIFGDGCGCALVEATMEDIGLVDSIMRCDGSIPESLHVYGGGSVNPTTYETINNKLHYVWQDGKVVFRHAVSNMADTCQKLISKNNLSKDEIDWVVPHQANLRIIDAVTNHLKISRERVMINIEKYGNTGAASIPLCLCEWESKLHKGDKMIFTAFGAGFTWGATYLKWGYDSH
ncbi:MAG: ketoacyl-ACP synthase III [Candidatus Azobacteroides pseudotrichonymphae]|jgi:3-oxoacyl-[acyl-carrier-protein] synthase-3|uniref:Beta-ketoacyl-[acyl-carrier-protein] synthase III n=1 Tax=Azobacteroides pseudotrichonymphae genomovar. CFP2 TaxID=511995 RepID=FABH_AZOPC|nr:beta-ketoacyl-ACP synthase III [Candidatus Azobacteroides pseudotrichonymphae]B6YS41.1 RecName: Full=Beta-ketoacyl-[acyl-carrier-protein] synthase III; Short=Beta-ketoacyl-ACP synthase III; Short=KAS III; AltName: Full=3-oxoacyl-[acyl-carrier-protein] synthase 3; AltName: Full=3-oxoacyl-[acyl-carrier-protein] synthase III [Candidatus Azobacteroides pseudotrichonymphae genomovar. CFP2]MDR0530020.1 ketoacyl-ACP synthase III [Bacteroidales bacterium OttesenSCG-928-I14]BAG84013.1 3-oxoacyl-[acyl-